MNYRNCFYKVIRKIERFKKFEFVIFFLRILLNRVVLDLINFLTFNIIIFLI